MTTFEELFKLAAEHDGEVRLSFTRPTDPRDSRGPNVKLLRIDVTLPASSEAGAKKLGLEREVLTRGHRYQGHVGPGVRALRDGSYDTLHLRDVIAELGAALVDEVNSPARMLTRLADGLNKEPPGGR